MKFVLTDKKPHEVNADILIFPVFEGEKTFVSSDAVRHIDETLFGMLLQSAKDEKFTGESGAVVHVRPHAGMKLRGVLLIGLGKKEERTVSDILESLAKAVKKAQALHAKSIGWVTQDSATGDKFSIAAVTASVLASYSFTKHKKKKKEKTDLETVYLIVPKISKSLEESVNTAQVTAKAVLFARDLVNEPPSETTPQKLAETAQNIAKTSKHTTCSVFNPTQIKEMGMGGLCGISQGSSEEPRFIHLTYNGGGTKTIVVIGKGITFDTGGLSLKSSEGMESMKMDMAGAAAVLAVFNVLELLHPTLTVHGLIAATENMPGPSAIKPGDVVTAMNGKTIEILNTDAEGRVILADALSYAGEKIPGADAIIDFATLTGACIVALGEDIAGLFSNNETLSKSLEESAQKVGEQVWRMPLVRQYKELLVSHVADIKNVTKTKYGGAIAGANFLEEFVPENTAWAHVDIAGPAFGEKDTSLCPHGGTGFGVRLVLDFLLSYG